MSSAKDRLKEIFENTVESDLKYEGDYKNPDYYRLFCKATSKEQLHKMLGNNLCMFNYSFKGEDAVLMIFSIAVNSNETGAKNIAERVIEVIACVEECFITIEYMKSEEIKEDKFVYVTIIKKIGDVK